MKHLFLLLFFIPVLVFAEPFYSPSWGFSLDLPEGYDYIDGDGKDRFSFSGADWIMFDLVVYNGSYKSMKDLVDDVNRRLENKGDVDFFNYRGKQAAVLELNFGSFTGWGLCLTLARPANNNAAAPMLLALSYSPASDADMSLFHMSALDSINPSDNDRYYPGPIMEYSYPRGEEKQLNIAGSSITIRENDAEAAQDLIEREFGVLVNYIDSPYWREAWIRYYRFIYRDSFDRVSDAASALVRNWKETDGIQDDMALAKKALSFVQSFEYERNLGGSDFVNMVTAITESRGDCDSRAMLWAIILAHADIRSAMMVSRRHSHAMGLVDIAGTGARFKAYDTNWLVAETTEDVGIGLIAQDVSDIESWLGIVFE